LKKPSIIPKFLSQRRGDAEKEEKGSGMVLRTTASLPVCVCFVLILLVSCVSAPKPSFSKEDEIRELSLLPAGGKFYVWADVPQSRPLLDVLSFEGMSGRDAARVLDNTVTAVAAVFESGRLQEDGAQGRRYFLAATGDFPRRRANFSLTFSKGWKKLKGLSGSRYWYSKSNGIALVLGSELALVSDSDPWEIFPGIIPGNRHAEIPQPAFLDFRRGLVLAGWLPNPSESIDAFMDSLGIPLQIPAEDFFFGAGRLPENAAGGPWELVFRIRAPSASHARALLGLFSMARLFVLRETVPKTGTEKDGISPQDAAALLFAKVPEQDGEFLTLRISDLDPDKIALLFNMFSVYSN